MMPETTDKPAINKQSRFLVEGMHCASCVQKVERTLIELPGVLDAAVNLATREARITLGAESPEESQIREAVERIGYSYERLPVGEEDRLTKSKARRQALRAQWQRLLIAAPLAAVVMVITMTHVEFPGRNWLLLALTAPIVCWAGRTFFAAAWNSLKHSRADMDTLIAMGTGTAFLTSLIGTVTPTEFWAGEPPIHYEAAAMITVFILLGRLLEEQNVGA